MTSRRVTFLARVGPRAIGLIIAQAGVPGEETWELELEGRSIRATVRSFGALCRDLTSVTGPDRRAARRAATSIIRQVGGTVMLLGSLRSGYEGEAQLALDRLRILGVIDDVQHAADSARLEAHAAGRARRGEPPLAKPHRQQTQI